ncbi:MAG: glutamine-hydrolyzing GMP synthase [Oligoflexia bacterium]|nr:glutamine-hydrolyzing GMP synthase [Oligoflexia bacterium]
MKQGFVILDFGSQYTWLIARRFRELGYYSEVLAYDESLESIYSKQPLGIILSGGPSSVLAEDSPKRSVNELAQIAPLLGICYGMQLIAFQKGGKLLKSSQRTYGYNEINWKKEILPQLKRQKVWMSHGDSIQSLPPQAELLSQDRKSLITAFCMDKILAFQFHPEVSHTEQGEELLSFFANEYCHSPKGNWSVGSIEKNLIGDIRQQLTKDEKVFCALSGGVDSTVTAILLSKALGSKRVNCVFVDTGLLREGEYEEVLELYKSLDLNIKGVRAEKDFLQALEGVSDPEQKRKIIGKVFIDVFKREMRDCQYLAQGTLYPDVIESLSPKGSGVTIKSHHNVGGLPENLNLKLIEPLRDLFKDEVRQLGKSLGLQQAILNRHPFPGPGLAIRCLGAITSAQLDILRKADSIYHEELKKNNLYDKIWQAFCVLLPLKTVGVQGDSRSYEQIISIRAVTSKDGMTADWFPFSQTFLQNLSCRIVNEVSGVGRVVYDVTSKPPGTIEWE